MAGKVILPPNYPNDPLIFLAGPIQGAPEWHDPAIRIIHAKDLEINIASPSRSVSEEYLNQNLAKFGNRFPEQVDWESKHLRQAADHGAILFWMPKEKTHFCERAYAQTTRFELGEWATKSKYGKCDLAVGIQPGFPGESYIRRRLHQDLPDLKIHITLRETCWDAIEKARS
ncbi:hypothetical protein HOA55_02970 [archaeon]|jgi:hypothetical protein|nr:hypothetical protein [archaeon]MBT3577465.1 hypothetical protein [archaeon]MBT6820292.1 hypothetical protein [archaeon]MBT6955989.1 hypothetical protein [archaeon]MBT7025106.1 hypothetical protein [archaeon]